MKSSFSIFALTLLLVSVGAFSGCGSKEAGTRQLSRENEPPAGAAFKAGRGVTLADETRRILDVQTVEVTEQKLPAQLSFDVQVFGEQHHLALSPDDHTGCDSRASALLPPDRATSIRNGQAVQIRDSARNAFSGVVLATQPNSVLGETEIIVGIANAAAKLKSGERLSATLTQTRKEAVTVIPRAALLRTVEGTFVYAVNGDAYFRTPVKTGAEFDGLVEITDGLLAGDAVVTRPVDGIYCIELRATKGGPGCCLPRPKK